MISNLAVNTTSDYAGLFGMALGATIKNVVMAPSCSITSSGDEVLGSHVGGVVGYCQSGEAVPCTIENIVNMANVTFAGKTYNFFDSHVGGIAGYLFSDFSVTNCANYGAVAHSGTASYTYVGGIVGLSKDSGSKRVQNCLNYGTVVHDGRTKVSLSVGGILGYGNSTSVENCLSAGQAAISTYAIPSTSTGGIAGEAEGDVSVTYCHWTSGMGADKACGKGTPVDTTATPDAPSESAAAAVEELNGRAETSGWSKWVTLHLDGGRIESISEDTLGVTMNHFPEPTKEGFTFSHWCKDAKCAVKYEYDTSDVSDVYVKWVGNNYTVTFDVRGGDELPVKEKIVTFNSTYGILPAPTKSGYSFEGWLNEEYETITKDSIVRTMRNHTLHADWRKIIYSQSVEIVFNRKDLAKEGDIRKIISEYTNEDFEIVSFESDGSGGTRVIIKFLDVEKAESFIESVEFFRDASDEERGLIKRVGIIHEITSFSPLPSPQASLFNLLMY